jgi:ssDNA-binding Zn-finger/Zn-ribbon topoisomerase 1
MALIKGTFTSEWSNGETIETIATLDTETNEVVTESVDIDIDGCLDREYFTDQENNEYEICPECHEYALKYSIDGETVLQEKHECPSCGYVK